MLVIAASAATTPESAIAATVSVRPDSDMPALGASSCYVGEPGEQNRLLISGAFQSTMRFTDSGAVIRPGASCRSIDAHTAECQNPGVTHFVGADVQLGDMDDELKSSGPGVSANGGPGNDTIAGASVAISVLNGGGATTTSSAAAAATPLSTETAAAQPMRMSSTAARVPATSSATPSGRDP
jgi:hypothetical protein